MARARKILEHKQGTRTPPHRHFNLTPWGYAPGILPWHTLCYPSKDAAVFRSGRCWETVMRPRPLVHFDMCAVIRHLYRVSRNWLIYSAHEHLSLLPLLPLLSPHLDLTRWNNAREHPRMPASKSSSKKNDRPPPKVSACRMRLPSAGPLETCSLTNFSPQKP